MNQELTKKHWDEVKVPFLDYNDALMLLYTREFFRWSQTTDKEKKEFIEKTICYLKKGYYLDPEELILHRAKREAQSDPRKALNDFYSLAGHLIDLTTIILDEAARLKNANVIDEWMQKKMVESVSGPLDSVKITLASLRESLTE